MTTNLQKQAKKDSVVVLSARLKGFKFKNAFTVKGGMINGCRQGVSRTAPEPFTQSKTKTSALEPPLPNQPRGSITGKKDWFKV